MNEDVIYRAANGWAVKETNGTAWFDYLVVRDDGTPFRFASTFYLAKTYADSAEDFRCKSSSWREEIVEEEIRREHRS